MNETLRLETEKLARSWMRHDAAVLGDYLVADVEDPRLNIQSLFTRHFLLRAVAGERFPGLIEQELHFATALNWLRGATGPRTAEEAASVLYALRRGADNAEGLEIPEFIQRLFASLPAPFEAGTVPNYIETALSETAAAPAHPWPENAPSLDTFMRLWRAALAAESGPTPDAQPTVLEPACGSANDYRFFAACGLADRLDYTGFDLCPKNVANAQALFPGVRFACGNVFAIDAPDHAYDYCVVHDLFEHLSLEGLEAALGELCRVTRRGLCLGFFNMDEIAAHREQPVDEYHWNTLSMRRLREAFAARGFTGRVVHIGSFLSQVFGWAGAHNPTAYTFELRR